LVDQLTKPVPCRIRIARHGLLHSSCNSMSCSSRRILLSSWLASRTDKLSRRAQSSKRHCGDPGWFPGTSVIPEGAKKGVQPRPFPVHSVGGQPIHRSEFGRDLEPFLHGHVFSFRRRYSASRRSGCAGDGPGRRSLRRTSRGMPRSVAKIAVGGGSEGARFRKKSSARR